MISSIQGILEQCDIKKQILEVQVGKHGASLSFEIATSKISAEKLERYIGREVVISTFLSVTDGSMELYGFYDPSEKRLFRDLIKIKNVGLKMALRILSQIDVIRFRDAIQNKDKKILCSLKGVGPKMIQTLINSLRVE